MGILKNILKFVIVCAPIIFALWGLGTGISIFFDAQTLTNLLKGFIIAIVSGISGIVSFFFIGSIFYE